MAVLLPGWNWLGVDGSEPMLARAREQAEKQGIENLTFKKLDFRVLDTLPNSYDFICATLVLHHMQSTDDAVKFINQCVLRLKPSGTLLIFDLVRPKTDHMARVISAIYARPAGELVYQDSVASLRAAFSYSELRDILHQSGFKNYEHVHDLLGVYQFVCTKAPRIHTHLSRSKTLQERLITAWYRLLFLGKM